MGGGRGGGEGDGKLGGETITLSGAESTKKWWCSVEKGTGGRRAV